MTVSHTRVRDQWNAKAAEWDAFARDDNSFWSHRLRQVTGLALRSGGRGRTLDVGCGPGHLMTLLADKGFDPHGYDLSEAMVQVATRRLSMRFPDSESRIRHTPDGRIPFSYAHETFDLVTAIGVLEYIDDRRTFLADLGQYVRPGGRLLVSNTNGKSSLFVKLAVASRLVRFWMNDYPNAVRNLWRTGIWTGGSVDLRKADPFYTADQVEQLLFDLGWEVVDGFDLMNFRLLDSRPLERKGLSARLSRIFGWNHVVVCKRRDQP